MNGVVFASEVVRIGHENHLKFFFILALFLCTGFSALVAQTLLKSQSPSCHEKRAVIDIGSAFTKLKVARVDTCLQKVVQVLGEFAEKVEFKKSLDQTKAKDEPGYFTDEILRQGLAVLRRGVTEILFSLGRNWRSLNDR